MDRFTPAVTAEETFAGAWPFRARHHRRQAHPLSVLNTRARAPFSIFRCFLA